MANEHNGGYMLTKKHPRSGQTGPTTVYRHPESGHEIHVETHGSKYPPSFWSLKPSRHGLNIDGPEYTFHKSFTSAMKDGDQFEKGKFRPVKKSTVAEERSSLRLTKTITHPSGACAKIYKDSDWGEHRVKLYDKDGKHLGNNSDYHTDDKEDAHDTAKAMLNNHAKKSVTEARDPADEDDVYDPATGGDPEEHAISQLHGAVGGNVVKFKDGTTHKIPSSHARLALHLYSKIGKPSDRADHAEKLGASRESFYSTINRKDPDAGATALASKRSRGRPAKVDPKTGERTSKYALQMAARGRGRKEKDAAKAAGTTVTTSRDELLAPRRAPAGFVPKPPKGGWTKEQLKAMKGR